MINFIKKQDNYFTEGLTEKGNIIYFIEVPENKLNFHREEINFKSRSQPFSNHFTNYNKPTRIVLYSNITISNKMLEALKQSRIIKIVELCNRNQQIVAYPLIGFNYIKLKKTLSAFVEEFRL